MSKKKPRGDGEQRFKKFAARPPRLRVLSDHPLLQEEAHTDSFELRYRVGPAYDIIRHPDTVMPMTIAIYGDWGMGKTSAMRWLHGLLEHWNKDGPEGRAKIRPVWFYPWKYDNKADVRRGLIAEVILNAIDVQNASTKTVISAAKKFGLFLGKSFLHTLASVKLKARTPGDLAEAEYDLAAIKEILAEYKEAAYPAEAYLNEFEDTLRDWVKQTIGKDGRKERMVIFIDDLDRCMPDIALQVLEALKLYLNIDNLIFVVGVDKDVIDRLVIEHYRRLGLVTYAAEDMSEDENLRKQQEALRKEQEEKARQYLCKMFQVEVSVLPSEQQMETLLDEQLKAIDDWNKLDPDSRDLFRTIIVREARRNPREVKRIINSAMMGGVGALMLSGDGRRESRLTFAQGLQLYFIERILADKHTMGTEARSKRGIAFFARWSEIVRKGRETDPRFPLTLPVPDHLGGPESHRAGKTPVDLRRPLEFIPDAYERQYHSLFTLPESSPLWPLLRDEELGLLMRVVYPLEVAREVATASESTPDAEIIWEAIARSLGTTVKELTREAFHVISDLHLENTRLRDLTSVRSLSRLQAIHLCGAPVEDLTPLQGLATLQWLDLSGTQVKDLTALQGLTNLQTLDLSRTPVNDLTPLQGLRSLQTLKLSMTQVSDFTPLQGLDGLQWLHLQETLASDLAPLRGLNNLQGLFLTRTRVSDLNPLQALRNLERLDVDETRVSQEEVDRLQKALPQLQINH